MNGNGHGGPPEPDIELLLKASENFLRNRNFGGCRKYVLQSQHYQPGNITAAQILTVADVLSAEADTRFNNTRPDWYSILGLDRFTHDPPLIRTRFKQLISLLNPNKNKLSLANEAFSLVRQAYAVLSDPLKKTHFDNELRIFESKRQRLHLGGVFGSGKDHTFWTMCPYCYYVYEYFRVYRDCCLRCQNQNCNRGFHAVEIGSPPPPEVLRSGQYLCLGFRPIGFKGNNGKGFSSWMPFSPTFESHLDGSNPSDDELMDVDGKKVEATEVPNVGKPVRKRMKSVANCSKKIMGKGIRVKKDERNVNVELFGGEDDDIFAGLQDVI